MPMVSSNFLIRGMTISRPLPNVKTSIQLTHSTGATESLGREFARTVSRNSIVGLSGDLGAGKTAWVRGFAQGLGYFGRVQSPSFGLIHEYHGGRFPIFHLDLYRLRSAADVVAAGLEVYLNHPDGVTVLEWPERWWPDFSDLNSSLPNWRRVWLRHLGDHAREVTYELPVG